MLRLWNSSRNGRQALPPGFATICGTSVSSIGGWFRTNIQNATATANNANQIDVQTGNVATGQRVEGWRLIDNATADIRKKSTQRYGVEF